MGIDAKCVRTINFEQFLNVMIHTAESTNAEYWDNPQVYLVAGDEHVRANFVLYNFKATVPLNIPQLKNLKIDGTLKYKVCT